ncbi:O-antigen ligase family protein [Clostridium sp.]|uniref:O-antigen ligase family protein n=1 Tax=Clostridium sp. TaxID=1506 RepID=UPI0039A1E208
MRRLNKSIFYYFILIPFLKPGYFESINILDNLFNAWRFLSSAIVISMYIKGNKVSKFVLTLLFFQLTLLISTLINKGDIVRWAMYSGINLSIAMIIELAFKNNIKIFLKVLYRLLSVIIVINYILLIIYPNGIYLVAGERGNFIDMDNLLAPTIIPGVLFAMMYSYIVYKKLKKIPLLIITISALTIIYVWPATAVVALFFALTLSAITIFSKKGAFLLNIRTYIVSYVVFFITIIFYNLQDKISFIIEDILGKSITFSGRTIIWENYFYVIKQSLQSMFLGFGVKSSNVLYNPTFGRNTHMHNQFFNIQLEGGLLAVLFFIVLIIMASNRLYKNRNDKIVKILSAFLFSFLLLMSMEVFRNMVMFIAILSFSYNNKRLVC